MFTLSFIYTVLHAFSVSDYTASQIAIGIGESRGMLRGRFSWLVAGDWLARCHLDTVKRCIHCHFEAPITVYSVNMCSVN